MGCRWGGWRPREGHIGLGHRTGRGGQCPVRRRSKTTWLDRLQGRVAWMVGDRSCRRGKMRTQRRGVLGRHAHFFQSRSSSSQQQPTPHVTVLLPPPLPSRPGWRVRRHAAGRRPLRRPGRGLPAGRRGAAGGAGRGARAGQGCAHRSLPAAQQHQAGDRAHVCEWGGNLGAAACSVRACRTRGGWQGRLADACCRPGVGEFAAEVRARSRARAATFGYAAVAGATPDSCACPGPAAASPPPACSAPPTTTHSPHH